jgi:hypothetical protein
MNRKFAELLSHISISRKVHKYKITIIARIEVNESLLRYHCYWLILSHKDLHKIRHLLGEDSPFKIQYHRLENCSFFLIFIFRKVAYLQTSKLLNTLNIFSGAL